MLDAKGNLTRWVYDGMNRMIRKAYADGAYDEYSYVQGVLASKRNARGQVTNYTYDNNGNVTLADYPNMTDVTLSYDAADQVTGMTDGLGATVYSRDASGRVTGIDGPLLNDTVNYTYDNVGRRTQLRINATDGADYGYDALDRLSSVTSAAGAFTYSYLGNTGQVSQLLRPNGTRSDYAYDALQRLTSIANKTNALANISSYAYAYNTRDVRTLVDQQVGAQPLQRVNFGYDGTDQLTSEVSTEASPERNISYAYDAMGNRTSASSNGTRSGVYASTHTGNNLNQTTGLSTSSNGGAAQTTNLGYDPSGNLTQQNTGSGGLTYVYDDENRLAVVVQRDTTTGAYTKRSQFVYDGISRKVISREYSWNAATSAWVQESETRRVYDGMNVVQERDSSNAVTVSYTRGMDLSGRLKGAGGIGGLLSRSTSVGHFYYHYDGGGNVVQLTTASQQVAAEYSYGAYGVLLSSTGLLASQPYRYSTKEFHAVSGLVDYGYRFYNAGLGKWINRDPIAEKGGLNLYGFVHNNPVNKVDPLGLVETCQEKYNRCATGGLKGAGGCGIGIAGFYDTVLVFLAGCFVGVLLGPPGWVAAAYCGVVGSVFAIVYELIQVASFLLCAAAASRRTKKCKDDLATCEDDVYAPDY